MRLAMALVIAMAVPSYAQDGKKQAPPKVDPAKVDAAIKKGIDHLKDRLGKYGSLNTRRSEDFILWTFVHAGVPEGDPDFQQVFKTVVESKLEWTYCVSLQAMVLEEVDRVRYQGRIQQCAQFLVDNQCKNGQWSYGEPVASVKDVPTGGGAVASGGGRKTREYDSSVPLTGRKKPRVVRKVAIQKTRDGPAVGDNSNSQYAALGLRACHDAGIVLPRETIALAEKWWRDSQHEGERSGGAAAAGWSYQKKNDPAPYGSMTAGAVGGLLICDYIQGRPWMKDPEVVAGLEWMGRNFSVEKNPGIQEGGEGQGGWLYYWLYAVERAGIFYGTEKIGGHEWYVEGARMLLDAQKPDGSWMTAGADHAIWDTCFAILFLRRATRPLVDVESVDRARRP